MIAIESIEIKDFGCIFVAKMPLSGRGMTLISGENRDTDAANNNGCGKTTIGHALTWGLFEETLDPLYRYDRVIRKGCSRAEVKIRVVVSGSQWLVTRIREAGHTILTLVVLNNEGVTISPWPGAPNDLQAKIHALLGRDFRSFCNTSFFGQADQKRFFSARDLDKKETLHRILRTDIFRACEKQLRENTLKVLYSTIDEFSERERNLVARTLEHDVDDLRRRSYDWETNLSNKIERELSSSNDLIFRARTYDEELNRKRGVYDSQIADLQNEIIKLTPLAEQFDLLRDQKETIGIKIQSARERLVAANVNIETAQEKLDRLSGDECPTCTAPLDSAAPARYLEAIRLESAAARVERTTVAGDLRKLEVEYDMTMEAMESVQDSRLRLLDATHAVEKLESEFDAMRRDSRNARQQLKERAMEHVERAKLLQREENPFEKQLKVSLEHIGNLDAELAETRRLLEAKREELSYYEFWVRGFGSRGLPSMMLDSIMPFLTERTNYYLRVLTDGDIVVEFSTLRELKSKKGETRDEITVSCTIEGVEDVAPSHAQRRKLEIATDMALIDLAGTRESAGDFLFLDEVMDGLDDEGEARVLRLLRELRKRYSSILVVTHETGLSESFDRTIRVLKENNAATVTEIE